MKKTNHRKSPNHSLVTFFDSNYLPKAIVTYLSLSKLQSNFTLYAFCFDDLSYKIIHDLDYKNFIPIKRSDFESPELLKSKKDKEKYYEYYWAYKPFLVQKIMDQTGAEVVTYIDCDFLFFQSLDSVLSEINTADVLLQPNNFSYDEVKQYLPVGYYCSCFESFRNNKNGKFILSWWHKKCLEWCRATFEKDKFADQKYLEGWRSKFKKVKEITTVGANIAPWNIGKYDISIKNNQVMVNTNPLIYYHFHSFKMNLMDLSYIITGDRDNFYTIPKEAIRYIYKPYIVLMKRVVKMLRKYPEYNTYAHKNPESNVHLIKDGESLSFSSYKDATE